MSAREAKAKSRRRVTLADVGRHATVDTSVVSRVLNNDPALNIRDETRERVLASVRELGYVPNAAARSLRTARTGTLGLFLPDFVNPVYAEIITGAEAAAAAQGYVLVTGSSSAAGVTPQTYLDLLGQGRVDGLLLAGEALSAKIQDSLVAFGLPYLLLNRRVRGSRRFVILDDQQAAGLAVEHLVHLGHTRIAHLAGPSGADTARRRRAGYMSALKAAGLRPDPDLVVAADYTPQGGVLAMTALLQRSERPSAVLVSNFAAAIGALSAARACGVRVPDEVSVVTIHDSPLAGFLVPTLTAVRMPLDDLGRRAVDLLLSRPFDEPVEEVVSGPIDLIIRQSTAPAPTSRSPRARK
jgi:LacI family transcriptional regulator